MDKGQQAVHTLADGGDTEATNWKRIRGSEEPLTDRPGNGHSPLVPIAKEGVRLEETLLIAFKKHTKEQPMLQEATTQPRKCMAAVLSS